MAATTSKPHWDAITTGQPEKKVSIFFYIIVEAAPHISSGDDLFPFICIIVNFCYNFQYVNHLLNDRELNENYKFKILFLQENKWYIFFLPIYAILHHPNMNRYKSLYFTNYCLSSWFKSINPYVKNYFTGMLSSLI